MYAGKTTKLLEEVIGLRKRGLVTHVIKAKQDRRFEAGVVVTHSGKEMPADQEVVFL